MKQINTTCSECGGQMEDGSIVDFRRSVAAAGEWARGAVEVSTWTGAIKNPERFVISAYRCVDCGYIKLYARTPATGSSWS